MSAVESVAAPRSWCRSLHHRSYPRESVEDLECGTPQPQPNSRRSAAIRPSSSSRSSSSRSSSRSSSSSSKSSGRTGCRGFWLRIVGRNDLLLALLVGSAFCTIAQLATFKIKPELSRRALARHQLGKRMARLFGRNASLGPAPAGTPAREITGGTRGARRPGDAADDAADSIAATTAAAAAAAHDAAELPPSRHPQYRLAFTVPWVGKEFPPWFPYFLASAHRSAYLADWLIFHENANVPSRDIIPPNILFHDLGEGGLGSLFGTQLAKALGIYSQQARLVELFTTAFRESAYIVTEYKPTHGTVFAELFTEGDFPEPSLNLP